MIEITLASVLGLIIGYVLGLFASWNKVHQHESRLRQLSNDISVMVDMRHPVPPEWVMDELDSIVTKDYR